MGGEGELAKFFIILLTTQGYLWLSPEKSPFLVASLTYAIYSLTEAYNPEEYNSVPMQGVFGGPIKIFLINNMELLIKKMELLIHKTVAHVLKKALRSDVNEVLQKLKGQ